MAHMNSEELGQIRTAVNESIAESFIEPLGQLSTIESEVAAINQKIEPFPYSRLLEKLALPLALGLLTFMGARAANRVAGAQVQLAQATADASKLQFERSLQATYIQIFYTELNSGQVDRQRGALDLLSVVEPPIAAKLSSLVARSPSVTADVKAVARRTADQVQRIASLYGFTIEIFYVSSDAKAMSQAEEVKQAVLATGFSGAIRLGGHPRAAFQRMFPTARYEVRYEPGTEDNAARELQRVLNDAFPQLNFALTPVGNTSGSYLSVFVPSAG
jgi:hypothetical protein